MKNYVKPVRIEKIIQFGEGGFLRGFVDWIVQLMNETTDFNAGVVIVQPIKTGMCRMLEQQNCVYTHVMRGMKNGVPTVEKKIIDSISRTVEPYEDFESYLKLAENSDFRFIVSNTTEAGITFSVDDTPEKAPNITFPAKLTMLLKRRYDLNLPGFIFLPCELIDRNGDNLKRCVLKYAKLWKYENRFAEWVEKSNTFCNTLVDRIVTGYPKTETIDLEYDDKLLNTSELFHLWVIEGDVSDDEFPVRKTDLNVIFTEDLERYRTRKVRILNGAHTTMIPYAMLVGLETVGDCMKDPHMRRFVEKCVYDEIIPTLDLPDEELTEYADAVFQRFENPYIRHFCSSISLNSVSKFKVRVLPSIVEYIKRKNTYPENLIKSFAKLIEFYKTDIPNDDAAIVEFMRKSTIGEILANAEIWGENLGFLTEAVSEKFYINK